MKENPKIVAVIPAYNEENTIEETIRSIKKIELINEIVVVNDGSTDETEKKARNMNVKIISLKKNRGKGYAIKIAIRKLDFDFLVLIDGDLGKSSEDIIKLIHPVLEGKADFTTARFKTPAKKGGFGFVKNLAKYGVFLYCGKRIDTTLSGQRVYSKSVVDNIYYIPNNFGVEVAMTICAFKGGFQIEEVDVDMNHRVTGRDIRGFIHRGKQFFDISRTLLAFLYRG